MASINERIQSLVPEFVKSMAKKVTQVICGRNSFERNVTNVRSHFRKSWVKMILGSTPRGTYTPDQLREFSNAPAIKRVTENFITETDFRRRIFEAQVKFGMDRIREEFPANQRRTLAETREVVSHYMSSSKPAFNELEKVALEVNKRLCEEYILGSVNTSMSSRTQIGSVIREVGMRDFGLGRHVEDIVPSLTKKVMELFLHSA